MLDALFRELFDAPPNAWQRAAYVSFVSGALPPFIKVPTAGGKTAVLAIFLAALAIQAQAGAVTLPRRLVLVVNRRALVDQASALAERLSGIIKDRVIPDLSDALARLSSRGTALAVSTLRGALADNGDWSLDPATPALILGTPDMIGSRLLFRGYGLGRSRAATHAGLLGIDTLIVHDEAHLAPAFSGVLREIEQLARPSAVAVGRPPLQVIEMTATLPPQADRSRALVGAVADDPILAQRMGAPKWLALHAIPLTASKGKPASLVVQALAEHALTYADASRAVVLFVSRPDDAARIAERLVKGGVPTERIALLTGTLRAWEREQLTRSNAFQRFSPERTDETGPTAYFICTSAGEVGLDIDADVGLMDLVTLDRFIQRAGRVNRRGRGIGELVLAHAGGAEWGEPLQALCTRTLSLLEELDVQTAGHDVSPLSLSRLTDDPRYVEAVPPPPPRRSLEPAILTQWAMTSLRLDALRVPAPDFFLHGLDDEDREVELVWRDLPSDLARLADWFEAWPVLRQERARLPIYQARSLVEALWQRAQGVKNALPAFAVLDGQGRLIDDSVFSTQDALRAIERRIQPGRTLVIRPDLGGLAVTGLPDAEQAAEVADVSAEGRGQVLTVRFRADITEGETTWSYEDASAADLGGLVARCAPGHKVVFVEEVTLPAADLVDEDAVVTRAVKVWLQARDIDGPDAGDPASLGRCDRLLSVHLDLARWAAQRLTQALGLGAPMAEAVEAGAGVHDLGKRDTRWQRAVGNPDPAVPVAKSRRTAFDTRLNDGYRHELGSVIRLGDQLSPLARHLVAAHHGWARPSFTDKAREKPGASPEADRIAEAFTRLNAQYGLWGLAYLETLVKSADVLAELDAEALIPSHDTVKPAEPVTPTAIESGPEGVIDLPADPRNFGEYLAAFGLLSLLEPAHPALKAHWTPTGFRLIGADDAAVLDALDTLLTFEAHLDHMALRPALAADKFPPVQLHFAGPRPPILINNWLRPDFEKGSNWKLSAGQTEAVSILRGLQAAARKLRPSLTGAADLLQVGTTMKERFRFDAGTSWSALDAGFSLNENDRFSTVRVFLELLSILGLQFAFAPPADQRPFRYSTWTAPLPLGLCLLAAKGLLPVAHQHLTPRLMPSGYMKDVFTSEITLSHEVRPCLPKYLIV